VCAWEGGTATATAADAGGASQESAYTPSSRRFRLRPLWHFTHTIPLWRRTLLSHRVENFDQKRCLGKNGRCRAHDDWIKRLQSDASTWPDKRWIRNNCIIFLMNFSKKKNNSVNRSILCNRHLFGSTFFFQVTIREFLKKKRRKCTKRLILVYQQLKKKTHTHLKMPKNHHPCWMSVNTIFEVL
jgi:hypothetical protein